MSYKKITILNPDIPKDLITGKSIILDIHLQLNDGSHMNIEMQTRRKESWRKRSLYYWAKLHSSQLEIGDYYDKICPTISIFIFDYKETNEDDFHSIVKPVFQKSGDIYSNDLELHILELTKVDNYLKTYKHKSNDSKVLWAKLFKARSEEDFKKLSQESHMFSEAYNQIKKMSGDKELIELARTREMSQVSYDLDVKGHLERGRAEGKAEGKAETLYTILELKDLNKGINREEFVSTYSHLGAEKLEKVITLAKKASTQEDVLAFLNTLT